MAVLNQNFTVYRGEDVTLNFTMDPVIDIAGWTLKFTAVKAVGQSTKAIDADGAVVSGPAGTFRVQLPKLKTNIEPRAYVYDVWRTDPGNERLLALGTVTVAGVARNP